MAGTREANRLANTQKILASARRQIAEEGAGSLSMRAVARDVGMVSSAVFRYFATRDDLITALVLESYGNLAGALPGPGAAQSPAAAWEANAVALRQWAVGAPHEFQLIYGTPIPGYQAPPETVPAAAAVAGPFLVVATRGNPPSSPDLAGEFAAMTAAIPGATAATCAAAVGALAQLIGVITLELSGHFTGVVESRDAFYRHVVDTQSQALGF